MPILDCLNSDFRKACTERSECIFKMHKIIFKNNFLFHFQFKKSCTFAKMIKREVHNGNGNETKGKEREEKKIVKEYNNSLAAIFGMLKGKIFCDDVIFNLDLKA